MNICFFGSYNPHYTRNKILIDGLKKNGISVCHCRSGESLFLIRYPKLIIQFLRVAKKIDVLYVAFVGQLDMPLAWILAKISGKKIVFDMFYSMYETYVFDRQSAKPISLRAKSYYWIDKIAGTLADLIITDTQTNADYFAKLFNIHSRKFRPVFIGGDIEIFKKKRHAFRKKLIIEYHGMITRLSGVEYFIQAAKKLERIKNIEFWLIGDSNGYTQWLKTLKKLNPKNLTCFGQLSVPELAEKVANADISIATLGITQKALNVISHKTYQGLATGNAVITIDGSGNRELLENGIHALLVKPGNVEDLVDKIKLLIKNKELRKQIANNGYLLSQQLSNKRIGAMLLQYLRAINISSKIFGIS